MGFLANLGDTLTYEESVSVQSQLKRAGVLQLLNLIKKFQNWTIWTTLGQEIRPESEEYPTLWGDEIEGHLVTLDSEKQRVRLLPCADQFIHALSDNKDMVAQQEYGSWMLEFTPRGNYQTEWDFTDVIKNLKLRTSTIESLLTSDQHFLTIPVFPMLGLEGSVTFENDTQQLRNEVTLSNWIDDRLINPHPRFPTLSANIRRRRGEKVKILVPLMRDFLTLNSHPGEQYPGFIHMDAMAFGMGNCCLQTTYSAYDFNNARWLYDQLSVFSPIALCLTAGSPIFKGKLADIDSRWQVIADSVDCRSENERNPEHKDYIPTSRYQEKTIFISNDPRNLASYNDVEFPLNDEAMQFAAQEAQKLGLDIDEAYLRQIGFIFSRDAMVVFRNAIEQDNTQTTMHFENFQSTNWNCVRIKPPPGFNAQLGWRVEFRPMEIQLTDEENAVFLILTTLLVKMLQRPEFKLNLYMPNSLIHENFKRARKRDAILNQKFYFRTNIFDDGEPKIQELSIFEIIFGSQEFQFPGLCGAFLEFVDRYKLAEKPDFNGGQIANVWRFIQGRCLGAKKTLASWIRQYVTHHDDYAFDSLISNTIAYDLTKKLLEIKAGTESDPNFSNIFKGTICYKCLNKGRKKVKNVRIFVPGRMFCCLD